MQRITNITPTLKEKAAPITVTVRTKEAFKRALADTMPGSLILYHTGFLLDDRAFPYSFGAHGNVLRSILGAEQEKQRHALDLFAAYIYRAYEKGVITLVQKRHGPGQYDYIAVKL
jgi:hypothetical protein